MNNAVINPKKAVQNYFNDHKVSYRLDDLKKTITVFIKQCSSDYEDVRLGKKSESDVFSKHTIRVEEILNEYFRNGNGERSSMEGFLYQVIEQKGRLYAQQNDNK